MNLICERYIFDYIDYTIALRKLLLYERVSHAEE
jgi:hypothetical protein